MAIIFLVILTTFLIVSIQLLTQKLLGKHGNSKYHPIGGTVLNQLANFSRMHDYIADLSEKYRTYRLIGPFRSEIYTSEPANVEYMLKTNFHNYGKGDYNCRILGDLLGDGIFAVDGEKWRIQRKVSSYQFSTRVLRDFSSVVFRKNAMGLANILSQAANSNDPVDIQALFMKVALDSIFQIMFGEELNTMCGSNEEGRKFSDAFNEASSLTLYRYVDVLWKIKRVLGIGSEARLKNNVKVIDEFVYKLISSKTKKMNELHDDSSDNVKREDILSMFLQLGEADPKSLRDITLSFITAGKDTTATALSWFVYMLCKHPLVQEKVAKEIEITTNSKDISNIAEFESCLSEESLEKMHYLHAAITETLRLYPSLPVDAKLCSSDDTWPDGFRVRKGDMVAYQPYAMGRMRFIWGDDALDFKPERWLDENACFKPESSFKFTAFQAGPRICLGKEFAYRQMKIFSAVLLRFFSFKLSNEYKEIKYRTMLTLHIDEGLSVLSFHR